MGRGAADYFSLSSSSLMYLTNAFLWICDAVSLIVLKGWSINLLDQRIFHLGVRRRIEGLV
jgi:hypothetical protein